MKNTPHTCHNGVNKGNVNINTLALIK